MKDERLYLSNIKECIDRIELYTCDGKEAFMQTPMIQDAVIRNFEIIGEATKRLSSELKRGASRFGSTILSEQDARTTRRNRMLP